MLALADGRQRDGAAGLAQRQIDHGGDGEPSFGGEAHGAILLILLNTPSRGWLSGPWAQNPEALMGCRSLSTGMPRQPIFEFEYTQYPTLLLGLGAPRAIGLFT
ncbi:hypothetical protein SRAA_0552 [Serpentinimonas raichei]|uniref:Uncharacterized protein n=1 Tax=Serpentinimonas raichei TaxID=1458425 RepID=A0A060NFW0_9BURK|nr:hypothetical protein SRAA_0552 [Serpentinimonas raichei]